MATTTNYGWAEPDNTSLVKNGAQDIRILGDAIDASVWNIGYGQAGKNKIINGDFGIWQRGTSITTTTSGGYFFGADRWQMYSPASSTSTMSRQTFTPGTAPVAGYEGSYFARFNCTNSFGTYFQQYIEDVRTFAGQTVTLSFWAKAGSAISISGNLAQIFGSGGSSPVDNALSAVSVTTSWQRFSLTVAVPSVSGKTIGTSSYLKWTLQTTSYNVNIDFWGAQIEYGSKATPFQTASGGSIQGELAMCQRYYWRATAIDNYAFIPGNGLAKSTTAAEITVPNPVAMRVAPTSVEYSNVNVSDGVTLASGGTITLSAATPVAAHFVITYGSGLTQYRTYFMQGAIAPAYLAFGAEL
jgi:hypothetical protein